MGFTTRLKQILACMLEENSPVSIKRLAEEIGTSKRTVQRELEFAASDLKPYQIQFCSKTGKGVWLEGEQEKLQILRLLIDRELQGEIRNREERRRRLLLEVLKDKEIKKLFYYSTIFQVSEATISSDLEAIQEWLMKQNLKITRKPGSGIRLKGSEESFRNAVQTFIQENMDSTFVTQLYEERAVSEQNVKKSQYGTMETLLQSDILKRVMDCIGRMQDSHILDLTENSYIGLVMHISIAMKRISQSEFIEQDVPWAVPMQQEPEYLLAKKITELLEQEFEINIPPIEIAYICLHIKGAKHQKIELEKSVAIGKKEMLQLVNEMIDAYDPKVAYKIKQDEEFIQGLLAHLQPTFIRITYDMKISNPVLNEVKKSYPEIFDRSVKAAKVMENYLKKHVPEEEVGFLAIHFGAAMVRLEGKMEVLRKVSIGVICASGIGISRLISSKLSKVFQDRIIVKTYGEKDITPFVISQTDFFVSSITFSQEEVTVVQISALITEKDLQEISRKVAYYERLPKEEKIKDSFSRELEEINYLAQQIRKMIQYMDVLKVSNTITFEELLTAIGEKLSVYHDLQEIIQEDIAKREKLGTQIFAEFGFALFHARSSGVIKPEFLVCQTSDLQSFENPYFKQIKTVIVMMLPIDEQLEQNSDMLGYLSGKLIEERLFLDTIESGNKEEIRAILSKYLKQYFNSYLGKQ